MTTTGSNPLVTVICLCYNHERFVKEAIESVLTQTYKNIELIVVDDKSTDRSSEIIKQLRVPFIQMETNSGNCKAFNTAWRKSNGGFVIDLAADDTLPLDRVSRGVEEFAARSEEWGVQFGDAAFMTVEGKFVAKHSERFPQVPEIDIYKDLIRKYFISSASLMIRRKVLEKLNGFDESLAYEDFDFLIRSSREFKYFYTPEILVNKRIVKGSMSDQQFKRNSTQANSTYKVCEKILSLNRNAEEDQALKERLRYELRHALIRLDFSLAKKYFSLLNKVSLRAYK